MTFDEIRKKYPTFSVSLYGVVPGEQVTLELITPEKDVFYFAAATAQAALDLAFPPESPAPPEPPAENVFD